MNISRLDSSVYLGDKMYFITILLFWSIFNVQTLHGFLNNFQPLNFALNMLVCNHSTNLNLDVSKINVLFYDLQNDIVNSFPGNKSAQFILSTPKLDKKKKFFIYVGGFRSPVDGTVTNRVKETFKKFGNGYLLIVDHSIYTSSKSGLAEGYKHSVQHVYYIGKQIAQILSGLHQGGIPSKNMHGIGHSLGSHILGYAGNIFFNLTNNKIGRISALDPAGPCFSNSLSDYHVRSGLADYVEVYHCNAGTFGSSSIMGDVDFFVNMGQTQPNCRMPRFFRPISSAKAGQCSHRECVLIWLASVNDRNRYYAFKECDKNQVYFNNDCWVKTRTTAGFWNPGNARGIYYFVTEG